MRRLHRDPDWLTDGDPEDTAFFTRNDLPCRSEPDPYFPNDDDDDNTQRGKLSRCRQLCAKCPAFEQCVVWGLAHYKRVPYGTLAGLSGKERRRIYEGKAFFRDWRGEWADAYTRRAAQNARNYRFRHKEE